MRNGFTHRKSGCYTALATVALLLMSGMAVMVVPYSTISGNGLVPWDGTVSSGLKGNGTGNDPYLIDDASDLAFLSYNIDDGDYNAPGICYRLTDDILLNDLSLFNVWGKGFSPDNQWNPIGSRDVPFEASLNGDGFIVFGMYIRGGDDLGLFGSLSGNIINLGLEKSHVSGNDNVGGIVGNLTGSISNSYSTADVFGKDNVGGIVGNLNGNVKGCYNNGSIYGDDSVGGIAGGMGSGSVDASFNRASVFGSSEVGGVVGNIETGDVMNCYNKGPIVASGSNVGGIAGVSSGHIGNCYSDASVSGGSVVGGIVGLMNGGMTENCYSSGKINRSEGGTVLGKLAGGRLADYYAYDNGVPMIGNTATDGAVGSAWGCFDNWGNIIDGSSTFTRLVDAMNGSDEAAFVKWTDTLYPELMIYAGPISGIWDDSSAEMPKGSGTAEDPYRIRNGEQLHFISKNTSFSKYNGNGVHYRLTAHILLNDTSDWMEWDANAPSNVWDPIGTADTFRSSMYGSGYTVQGMYVSAGPDGHAGLFGMLGGYVENIGVVNGYVNGPGAAGGIAAVISGTAEIYGCYNSCTVTSLSNAGGMVGMSDGMTEIHGCDNIGKIIGNDGAGGILGLSTGTLVTTVNCFNSGDIDGNDNVGGIIGNAYAEMVNCFNTGHVTSSGSNVGGIAGTAGGTIEWAMNFGNIDGISNAGGIIGTLTSGDVLSSSNHGAVSGTGNNVGGLMGESSGKIQKCYNDASVEGKDGVGGLVGYNKTSSTISDSYNRGPVKGYGDTGGIAGINSGRVVNSYQTSSSVDNVHPTDGHTGGLIGHVDTGGTMENCYADITVNGPAGKTGLIAGKTSGEVSNCYAVDLLNAKAVAVDLFGDGTGTDCYPINSMGWVPHYNKSLSSILNSWVINNRDHLRWGSGVSPSLLGMGTIFDSDLWSGRTSYRSDGAKPFSGSGTETDPYRIRNCGDLFMFAELINTGVPGYNGKQYILAADIVINDSFDWLDKDEERYGLIGWDPIGNTTYPFSGVFDGSGYTVIGMYVYGPSPFSPSSDGNAGLFGDLSGTVCNVGVSASTVFGEKDTGGIAGYLEGMVINSYSSAKVLGKDNTGGIAGMIHNGTVMNCSNIGDISGRNGTGGIAGTISEGTVMNCHGSGNISGDGYVGIGGIVGTSEGNVINVLAAASVSGNSAVGGIIGGIGPRGTLNNGHSTASVTATGTNGSIVGSNEGSSKYSYASTAPLFGSGTGSDCLQFDGELFIDGTVTIQGIEYSGPFQAMNIWSYFNNQPGTSVYLHVRDDGGSVVFSKASPVNTLASSATGNGKVSPEGMVPVFDGEEQRFTFTPDSGHKVTSVLVDGINNADAVIDGYHMFMNVTSDHTIEVTFGPIIYSVTVEIEGNGDAYAEPSEVTIGGSSAITVVPDNGHMIHEVTDNLVPVAPAEKDNRWVYVLNNVTEDHVIRVSFIAVPMYSLVLETSGGNGSFRYSVDGEGWIEYEEGATVVSGSDVMIELIPANGFKLKEWSDGSVSGTVTVDDVSSDVVLIAYLMKVSTGSDDDMDWNLIPLLYAITALLAALTAVALHGRKE